MFGFVTVVTVKIRVLTKNHQNIFTGTNNASFSFHTIMSVIVIQGDKGCIVRCPVIVGASSAKET